MTKTTSLADAAKVRAGIDAARARAELGGSTLDVVDEVVAGALALGMSNVVREVVEDSFILDDLALNVEQLREYAEPEMDAAADQLLAHVLRFYARVTA